MEVFLFFYYYVFFFFLSFLRVISFPTKNIFFLCRIGETQKKDMRAPPLSLSLSGVLLNNLTIFLFIENANDGSQHLRDMLPFSSSSSLFFIFISVFFRSMRSMNFFSRRLNVTDRHALYLPPSLSLSY